MAHRPDTLCIRTRVDYRTSVQQTAFINTLKKVLNVSVACEIIGLKRSTVYTWRENDEDFKERWEDALAVAQGSLESSVYLKLAQVLTDDRKRIAMPEAKLAELLLAGAFPEKYRQRGIEIDNSVNTANLTIDWAAVPDEIFNAYRNGAITVEDVYQQTLLLKDKVKTSVDTTEA